MLSEKAAKQRNTDIKIYIRDFLVRVLFKNMHQYKCLYHGWMPTTSYTLLHKTA